MQESGIYKITYRGKVYIGQSKNVAKRLHEHLRLLHKNTHHNKHLQQTFNKYGDIDLQTEVIEYCSEDQLDDRETYWIEYYDSYKNGYNQTSGGTAMPDRKVYKTSHIVKNGKRIKVNKVVNLTTSEFFNSANEAFYKYHATSMFQLYKACKTPGYIYQGCLWCYDYYGIDLTQALKEAQEQREYYQQMIVKSQKNNNINNGVKIINVTTGDVFDSINQAAKHYNINYISILNCINSKQHTTHGYVFMKYDDYKNGANLDVEQNNKSNKIFGDDSTPKMVINIDTLTVFDSISQASKMTNVHSANISECCNGRRKYAGGFRWAYYDKDTDPASITSEIPPKTKLDSSPKKVIDITSGIIYENANQASKALGLIPINVYNVCKGKLKATKGHVFKYCDDYKS